MVLLNIRDFNRVAKCLTGRRCICSMFCNWATVIMVHTGFMSYRKFVKIIMSYPTSILLLRSKEAVFFISTYIQQYINNCPTRCNTKQSIYYSASSLYMFRVSVTPIIRSTQNCNNSLRYWPYFFVQASLATLEGGSCTKKYGQYRRLQLQFCVLLMIGVTDTRNM